MDTSLLIRYRFDIEIQYRQFVDVLSIKEGESTSK